MTPVDEATMALVVAIRTGYLDGVRQVLTEHPGLVSAPLGGRLGGRTALHVATDWPGYFPNGPQVVALLIAAGADPDGPSPHIRPAPSRDRWADRGTHEGNQRTLVPLLACEDGHKLRPTQAGSGTLKVTRWTPSVLLCKQGVVGSNPIVSTENLWSGTCWSPRSAPAIPDGSPNPGRCRGRQGFAPPAFGPP